jgi:cytochrome oxidase Cu insertion factor (SCO1/SenC/PrrC family)
MRVLVVAGGLIVLTLSIWAVLDRIDLASREEGSTTSAFTQAYYKQSKLTTGKAVVDFELRTIGGGTVHLADLKDRPVVLILGSFG